MLAEYFVKMKNLQWNLNIFKIFFFLPDIKSHANIFFYHITNIDKTLEHLSLGFEGNHRNRSDNHVLSAYYPRGEPDSVAPGTTAGVSTGPLPVPEHVQLLGRVLGGRQHVQVALLLTQPA